MAARIPVSWLILLVILVVFAFFGYQILQAANTNGAVDKEAYPPYSPSDEINNDLPPPVAASKKVRFANDEGYEMEDGPAPVSQKQPPIPNEIPYIPGQTEDDLRTPEPLQRTPPPTYYNPPDAIDQQTKAVYMDAEFGSNFRHPEQMIEHQPQRGMKNVVESGIGAVISSPGGNNADGYSPELIQNAGEFMNGVIAFDSSEMGSAFSML